MARTPIEVVVAGQRYRLVSSASSDEVRRLAALVDDKLHALVPEGKAMTPQAMLLAAMAFAHEADASRRSAEALRTRTRTLLEAFDDRVATATAEVEAAMRALSGGSGEGATDAGLALELHLPPEP